MKSISLATALLLSSTSALQFPATLLRENNAPQSLAQVGIPMTAAENQFYNVPTLATGCETNFNDVDFLSGGVDYPDLHKAMRNLIVDTD